MSLMTDATVVKLRNDALRLDEFATAKFWCHIFNKFVFFEPYYVVAQEQPPVEIGTQRRVDIVVENGSEGRLQLLLYAEAKKGRAGPNDIANVESQAYSACYEHYLADETRNRIWAMTCYGSFVRFWAFDSQSALLTPYYPTEGDDGERTAYVDFKSHENDIMQALAYIKETPIPPSSLFEQPVAYDQPTEEASSQAYYAYNQGHHTEYVSSQSERQNTIASGFSFTDARLEATHDQPMEVDDESGDPVAEPTASTSQATGSKQDPAHKKVDIIKEEHSIRSTKYLFRKHKRGHVITTKIEDWDRIKVQDGKEAWYWKEDNKYWGYKPK